MRSMTGVVLMGSLLVVGCAALRQVKEDVQVGQEAPLASGEAAPAAQAAAVVESVKPFIPTPLQPLAGFGLPLVAGFLAWRRGRRIRLGQEVSAHPITGNWGQSIGAEAVVQQVATLVRGVYEVGPEGSGLRRGWKVGLSVGVAALLIPLVAQLPGMTQWMSAHAEAGTVALGAVAAIVSGLEKEFSKVLPVKPA